MEKKILKTGIIDILSNSERYITKIGEISLLSPCRATFNSYEIYCINGNLFEDIERYSTRFDAEKRINNLLCP